MNLENVFNDVYSKQSSTSDCFIRKSLGIGNEARLTAEDVMISESMLPAGPQEEFTIQNQIRPLFNKHGINDSAIGTHPDFIGLELTNERINQYSCTMFIDIKGSTRLSLLYDLEKVFLFKNAVIKTCIEVVRSFDGYVHRLMGDAVMSFFGQKDKSKEDSIADAINCATTLKLLLEHGIKPWMDKNNYDPKDFGFRIGVDFGEDNEVVWGNFGYSTVGEVSATGLSVDMASKLQNRASKNNTMLGQGLLDFVNWPDHYSKYKTVTVDGVRKEEKIVTPNITYGDGTCLDYRMKELCIERFIEISALPDEIRSKVNTKLRANPAIIFKCFVKHDEHKEEYISASKFLDKHIELEFEVTAMTGARINFPLKVRLSKTNYGPEVPKDEEGQKYPTQDRTLRIPKPAQFSHFIPPYVSIFEQEGTLYRGLHSMQCEVYDKYENLIYNNWIGVMIK